MTAKAKQSTLLIVDDIKANLNILLTYLQHFNFKIIFASDGEEALEKLRTIQPDLILLDILLPGMDGFETCIKIKSNALTRDIPVIFMTILDGSEAKVRGFNVGAVDYITKPFYRQEVLVRINTQLMLLHQKQQLQASEKNLAYQLAQKNQRLEEANKKLYALDQAKSDFLSLISHEMRTPLTGLLASADLLFNHQLEDTVQEDIKEALLQSLDRLHKIIKQALLLTDIKNAYELFSAEKIPLDILLSTAINRCESFAHHRKVSITPLQPTHQWIKADDGLFVQALDALISTAIKFSHEGKAIVFHCEPEQHYCILNIEADGLSIPDEYMDNFFDVLSIANPITPGGDLGLEPPVADQILQMFSAYVEVKNKAEGGIIFKLYLPTFNESTKKIA